MTGGIVECGHGWGHRGTGEIPEDIVLQRRPPREPTPNTDMDLAKSGVSNEGTECGGIAQSEGRSQTGGGLRTHVALQGVR
jgi:hypothetical protein